MGDKCYNVLFLCTGNSARSIMAEALLNRLGDGRFRAFSAGSHPKGIVHPLAIELLKNSGHSVDNLHSKDWQVFATPTAPAMDFIFTLCDKAAGEACPTWPGRPISAHWGLEDPAAATGTDADRRKAFTQAYRHLINRLQIFLSLPIGKLDALSLQQHVREIGRTPPDATEIR